MPVIVDSGFRRGTDAVKALAMGAQAVGIGRPYLWGLGAFGQEGVERCSRSCAPKPAPPCSNAARARWKELNRELRAPGDLGAGTVDPDMSPWRTTPGTRQHSAHTYYVSGVFEQSWRVRHWKVFWGEWYWVSGPEPEGRIEQDRGPAFDLQPGDIPDLPALAKTAARTIVGDAPAELTEVKIDSKNATVWLNSSKGISWVDVDRQTLGHTEQ
jgi:hypothetical protein